MKVERGSWYKDEEQGVIRWCSNKSIPPEDCIQWLYDNNYIGIGWKVKSIHLRQIEVAETIARYCEYMENHVPDEEELFEMRAAFGEGATVVNAITGKVTQL